MILKTRLFNRWLKKSDLTDSLLASAVEEMMRGLIDADLGGGVYKNTYRPAGTWQEWKQQDPSGEQSSGPLGLHVRL